MDYKSIDEQVIQKYQEDEQLMIQLFVQWCKNHNLNPMVLYKRAYPDQPENNAMLTILDESVDEDILDIDNGMMLDVLQLFGNDDLAFVMMDEINRIPEKE